MINYVIEKIESESLKDNIVGDPSTREILTFLPPENDQKPFLLIELAGLNWKPVISNKFGQIIGKLFSSKKLKRSIVINPNFKTKIYVNQYINSPILGSYENFIINELITYFREKYDIEKVALFGKSSGGFGAYTLAVRHPDIINGFANHFGDSCFEYMYIQDFLYTNKLFRSECVKNWLNSVLKGKQLSEDEMRAVNVIGSAFFYSPNLSSEIMSDLPIDLETGGIEVETWAKWLSFDPAKNIEKHLESLSKLKGIYLDVGTKDEYNLFVGIRTLHKKMAKMKIQHKYCEFEGGHFGNSSRYEYSLPYLEERLSEQL